MTMLGSFNQELSPPVACKAPPKEYQSGTSKPQGVLGTTSALPAMSVMPRLSPIENFAGSAGLSLGLIVRILPAHDKVSVFSARSPATAKLTVVSLTVASFTGFVKSTWMGWLKSTLAASLAGEC